MRKLFKNRYFLFLMIYLCFISILVMNFAFSKNITGDSSKDASRSAKYGTDLVIYQGERNAAGSVRIDIFATSKLSEPETMIDGTCDFVRVRFTNLSECTVRFSDLKITSESESEFMYTKLIIDADSDYIKENRTLDENENAVDNGIAASARKYLDNIMAVYNADPALIEKFKDDPDFKWDDEIIRYDPNLLDNIDYLNQLIRAANKLTVAKFTDTDKNSGGAVLAPNEGKTFIILFWCEHDDLYKADADKNGNEAVNKLPDGTNDEDKEKERKKESISHKTPTQLVGGNRSDVAETFYVSVYSEQVD